MSLRILGVLSPGGGGGGHERLGTRLGKYYSHSQAFRLRLLCVPVPHIAINHPLLSLHHHRQKWLAVVGLSGTGADENGGSPKALRKLAKQNKYEIKTVQWNPHPTQVDLLASTVSRGLQTAIVGHFCPRLEGHCLVR